MVHVDEFESQFKRAIRDPFKIDPPTIERIALIQDSEAPDASEWVREVVIPSVGENVPKDSPIDLTSRTYPDAPSIRALVEWVSEENPSLIVTFRLIGRHEKGEFDTLGSCLDVLLQSLHAPVLILPRSVRFWPSELHRVAVVSDSLERNARLVNFALLFARTGGCIHIAGVESEETRDHFMHLIERIPDIDTDMARSLIEEQVFHEGQSFQEGVVKELREQEKDLSVESTLCFGRGAQTIREIVTEAGSDLLVINTREGDHPAMGGLSYTLAVTMQDIPLLLI